MKIVIITPAAARVRNGNRNTALRWAAFLRRLGHRVNIQVVWDGRPADVMLALHARRSHDSIRRFAAPCPDRLLVVVLTGTDLYRDIRTDPDARASLALASRLVVLQEKGREEIDPALREKVRVIYQSARPVMPQKPLKSCFEVGVIGNLREEKDPFRCALAARLLPPDSHIRVTQIGGALDPQMEEQADKLAAQIPRYRWMGELPHWKTMRLLARSRLMVNSSRMEGGANVVAEAVTAGVPVIASDISGNIGMLGEDYAGYYPCGDERALAGLLARAERDGEFYRLLKEQCAKRKSLFTPESEAAGLARLLEEMAKK
jgi:putative glycosyltransferase (TIGR04348 family)